mgnify:CR=1 FL=1
MIESRPNGPRKSSPTLRESQLRVIGGEAKGRRIRSLRNLGARPTTERVRSGLFSILESYGLEDRQALDLYSGTGSLGIEAISRGAKFVDFVESDPKRCSLIRNTLDELGFSDRGKVYCMKAESAVAKFRRNYDLILMDPPYTLGPVHGILIRVGDIVLDDGLVVVGHSKRHSLENCYQNMNISTERQYGDTVVSIYRQGG